MMQIEVFGELAKTKKTNSLSQAQIRRLARKISKILLSKKIRNRKRLEGKCTIVFVSAAKMRKINSQFRGKDKVTDILSFEGNDEHGTLGELVICGSLVGKQAQEHLLSVEQELAYLILHGMLHLLGYEHENSKIEAAKMFALQDALFAEHFTS